MKSLIRENILRDFQNVCIIKWRTGWRNFFCKINLLSMLLGQVNVGQLKKTFNIYSIKPSFDFTILKTLFSDSVSIINNHTWNIRSAAISCDRYYWKQLSKFPRHLFSFYLFAYFVLLLCFCFSTVTYFRQISIAVYQFCILIWNIISLIIHSVIIIK